MKVASAPFYVAESIAGNLARIEALVDEAHARGARVVHFPAASLGWTFRTM